MPSSSSLSSFSARAVCSSRPAVKSSGAFRLSVMRCVPALSLAAFGGRAPVRRRPGPLMTRDVSIGCRPMPGVSKRASERASDDENNACPLNVECLCYTSRFLHAWLMTWIPIIEARKVVFFSRHFPSSSRHVFALCPIFPFSPRLLLSLNFLSESFEISSSAERKCWRAHIREIRENRYVSSRSSFSRDVSKWYHRRNRLDWSLKFETQIPLLNSLQRRSTAPVSIFSHLRSQEMCMCALIFTRAFQRVQDLLAFE